MKSIEINTANPYKVLVGGGLLGRTGELAAELVKGRNALIVSGSNVFPLYGDAARESLEKAGFSVCSLAAFICSAMGRFTSCTP